MFASCPVQLTKWLACEKGMQWCQAFEALVCTACYCYLVRLLLSSRTRHGCSTVAGALLAHAVGHVLTYLEARRVQEGFGRFGHDLGGSSSHSKKRRQLPEGHFKKYLPLFGPSFIT